MKIAEAMLLCDNCSDFLVYTAWRHPDGLGHPTSRALGVVGHWQEATGLDRTADTESPIFPNIEFGFNKRNLIIGSLEVSFHIDFIQMRTVE